MHPPQSQQGTSSPAPLIYTWINQHHTSSTITARDEVPCTPDLRAVFQFYFTELFVFGSIFATFQQDRIEENCLCDTNTLTLPEFQHSKEGYDDYDTRMFVFKQIRKMDTGASM